MAKTSGIPNESFIKLAVVEIVDPNTPLDERDMRLRAICSDYKEDYPYMKT